MACPGWFETVRMALIELTVEKPAFKRTEFSGEAEAAHHGHRRAAGKHTKKGTATEEDDEQSGEEDREAGAERVETGGGRSRRLAAGMALAVLAIAAVAMRRRRSG